MNYEAGAVEHPAGTDPMNPHNHEVPASPSLPGGGSQGSERRRNLLRVTRGAGRPGFEADDLAREPVLLILVLCQLRARAAPSGSLPATVGCGMCRLNKTLGQDVLLFISILPVDPHNNQVR